MWAAHAEASSWCEGSSECSEGGGAPEQPTLKGTPPTRSSRPESTYMMGLAGSPGAGAGHHLHSREVKWSPVVDSGCARGESEAVVTMVPSPAARGVVVGGECAM